MHPLAFKTVQQLEIMGSVSSIQSNLFESFKQLNEILVSVDCLGNFYHKIGIEWMTFLLKSRNMTWITFSQDDNSLPHWMNPGSGYVYPNKDLCLFAAFPFNTVMAILDSNLSTCTDSMAWLTQNYHLFDLTSNQGFTDFSAQVFSICWNTTNNIPNKTAIKTQIEQCSSVATEKINETQMEYYGIKLIFQFAFDLLAFVLIPFASIFGLLINLRVIYTINKNSKVEFKEDFYSYMMINSIFNCLYCLVYTFYPVNYCQLFETGYFCSLINATVSVQVIKIVFIGFFGEVFKMCSNISYIFVTINRYMLIGKDHNSILEKISKLDFKAAVAATVAFSLLMNIGHAFQYRINWGWGALLEYEYLTYDFYPSIVVKNSPFNVYAIVYFFVNFALFFFINTGVELSLLHNLRKEIEEKRTKLKREIQESQSKNTTGSEVINKVNRSKQKKIEQDAKKETRATVMVISNGALNFFLRFPEILVFISSNYSLLNAVLYVNSWLLLYSSLTVVQNISSMIVSLSYFSYILTFTTNVAIYVVFNPIFKKHFILWDYNVKQK
jgi:hypothetical protein